MSEGAAGEEMRMTHTVGIVIDGDVMVPALDGVLLATDIYRPDGSGPFPVLLERTPYDKSAPSRSERTAALATPRTRVEVAAYFVEYGYAVAYQDCRGRYCSGGKFTKYLSEAEDGYDTLTWLVRQPWCNGRVGTFGLSYAAHTQAALGCLDPPGLAAQFLDCGGFSNAYRSGIRHGGAFDLKQATWAYRNALADARDPAVKAALEAQDIRAWFRRMPWHKGDSPISAAPEYEDYLFEQWSHGVFDDYWKQPGIYAEGFYDRNADVPIVHLSGWYDPYARTAMENYLGLSRAKRSRMQLILGPWTHGDRSLSYAGEVEFGPAAPVDGNLAEDFFDLRRRWFDRWIKRIRDGSMKSRRCASLSWAVARDGAMPTAGSIMAAGGAMPANGRCRRPAGPAFTCSPTAAWSPWRQPSLRLRSSMCLIHGIRRRPWAAPSVRVNPSCAPAPSTKVRSPVAPMCWCLRRHRWTMTSKSPGQLQSVCGSPRMHRTRTSRQS
jgi:predicted acyl esterase